MKIIPRILLVSEGEVTEPLYFEGLRKHYRVPKDLLRLEAGKGDPKTLVDLAVRLKKENISNSSKQSGERFDQVWCVFDRDIHEHIPDAQQKAHANGIQIAFSNPCFELFLLLHFCDCTEDLHRSVIQRRLANEYIPNYEKAFDYELVRESYELAKTRAEFINSRSQLQDQIQSAPFCSVPVLVDAMTPPTHKVKRFDTWIKSRPFRR